ncbi:MAG TPA: hypothetical protein PLT27_01795 [Nitrospira sp.]|nr:hypothetical protein [Nitrospira sp.]
MQRSQLGQCCWRDAQQKSPQRRRIRVRVQPREVLEHPVLSQQLGCLNAFQAEDHRIEQSQQHLSDAVAMVPLSHSELSGNRVLEANSRQEPM